MKKILAFSLVFVMLAAVCCAGFVANAEEPEMFWVSHYDDGTAEGAGAIFTTTDNAGGWWIHVGFAPVEGTNSVYEITAITDGIADGLATAVEVPEGGFVWAANVGNNYIDLGIGDTNFVNDNCSGAIQRAQTWAVGDQFVIAGVDFETIPTTTPDTLWYDPSYVCTATIVAYDGTNDIVSDSETSDSEASSGEDVSSTEPEVDPVEEYTNSLVELVGADREAADFDLALESTVDENGIVTVTMTVENIKEGVGLQALFAKLVYDDEKMELVTGLNEDEALDIMTAAPSTKWENLSAVLLETNEDGEKVPTNVINVNLFVASDDTIITADAPLVATIQFQLKEGCTYGGVYAATETVDSTGYDAATEKFVNYYGNGAAAVAVVDVEDDESSTPSTDVDAGDTGIIVFAVLGVIAIAGAAVVVKVRH